jgi:hypothetical protein
MRVYGSSYGNSAKARRDQVKKEIDTLKGPKSKDLMQKDKEDYMKTKGQYDEAAKPDFLDMDKDGDKKEPMKKAVADKKMKEDTEFKDKLIEALKGNQHKIDKNKNNKIDAQDFKILRKEESEQLDELSPDALKSYVNKAKPELRASKEVRDSARQGGDGKTANDMYQLAKKRTAGIKQAKAKLNKEDAQEVEVVMDELNGYAKVTIGERSLTEPEMKKREEVVKSMKKGFAGFRQRYGKDAKSVMYATATKQAMKEELDEAVSRKDFQMVADLIKTHDNHDKRKELATHHAEIFHRQNPRFDRAKFMQAANVQEEIDPRVRTKDTLKGQEVTSQSDDVGPNSNGRSTKVKFRGGPMKEEVKRSDIPAFIRKARGDKPLTVADVKAGSKDSISSKENLAKARGVSEGKGPESDTVPFVTNADQPPFEGPYKKIGSTVTDKSGAKHTPMSRARDLARAAMKRIKTEMLGKAPGNNG